jgi:bisphosphoglycerate-dependent phosphoglycerate mutase
MATALEKFQHSMNTISPYWTKDVEVTAQEGEIVLIKCEGFCFKSDRSKEMPECSGKK